jgi:hypothetical protein
VGVNIPIRSKGCVTQLELVVSQLQLLQLQTEAPPWQAQEGEPSQLDGYADARLERSTHGDGCCSIELASTRFVTWKRDERFSV